MRTSDDRTRAWLERTNPLLGLSVSQAQGIFDAARGTGSALLHRIYAEIESADPILMTCVERRASALACMGWRANVLAESDAGLADEQRKEIAELANGIDNLDEAIEHLDGAFFRGYAHVQPIWEDGVKHVNLLNSWNFLRDLGGRWYWNPDCKLDATGLESVDGARLVTVTRPRAIDYPAMIIYIRKALGERDWGRFVERYGIPPVDAVMGPDATNESRAKYVETALAARDGDPAVWPNGTVVTRAEGSRGQDPFTAFIEHQQRLVVLMATGGTLTSLAEADTGSLAGGAQMEVWTQIVRRDAQLIGAALNRALFRPYLESKFPGRPICANFELGLEEETSAEETADLAVKIKSAGYTVDQAQLEEKTGLKLEKEQPPVGGDPFGGMVLNKAKIENDPPPRKDSGPENTVLAAFAKDTGAAAAAVRKLLENPTPEAAAALLKDLPNLIPEDPALAAVIAEEMAKEFKVAADARIMNKLDANGMEHAESGEDGGQFVSKSGSSSEESSDKNGTPDEHGYTQENRSKIGQTGDWATLGLPPMRDIPADEAIEVNDKDETKKRILQGETVVNPFGETLPIDQRCLKHFGKKRRSQEQLDDKLEHLDAARATIERPHEIWIDEVTDRRKYVKVMLDPSGRRIVNAVDEIDHVFSWHTNDHSLDHYRNGKLIWIRQ